MEQIVIRDAGREVPLPKALRTAFCNLNMAGAQLCLIVEQVEGRIDDDLLEPMKTAAENATNDCKQLAEHVGVDPAQIGN